MHNLSLIKLSRSKVIQAVRRMRKWNSQDLSGIIIFFRNNKLIPKG